MYPQRKRPYAKPEITVIPKNSTRYTELLKASQQMEPTEDIKQLKRSFGKEETKNV